MHREHRRLAASRVRTVAGLSLSLCAALALAGCSSISSMFSGAGPQEAAASSDPGAPKKLYDSADALLSKGDYEESALQFERVDQDYPYSPEARRAIALSAFAYYKAGKYDQARSAGERYLTLHPGTKEAELAQHIVAMSWYKQINDSLRDQSKTRKAKEEFETLVRRYPDSRYAENAKDKIRVVNDVLAAKEMDVGRYYLKRNDFVAAINRFKKVVSDYQTTVQVEEALARLTEAYVALGILSEAQAAAAVLGHNFPDSKWYKRAYALLAKQGLAPKEDSGSWVSRQWSKVTSAF